MEENAFVYWLEHEIPWSIEREVLTKFSLPLNIQDNEHHAFSKTLSSIRVNVPQNPIKTPKYFLLRKNYERSLRKKMKDKNIKFPIVIKPINEGSSLGVYICKNKIQFNRNYNKLQKEYDRILVEEYIPGNVKNTLLLKNLILRI